MATHVRNIMNKLGVNSRAQVAGWMVSQERYGLSDSSHAQDGHGSQDGAYTGDRIKRAVGAAADRQNDRRDGRSNGEGKCGRDVQHAEVLGDSVLGWQHVDDQSKVDSRIRSETESADSHADQESVEGARDGDDEHRDAVDNGGGENEDLPAADPVRQLA